MCRAKDQRNACHRRDPSPLHSKRHAFLPATVRLYTTSGAGLYIGVIRLMSAELDLFARIASNS